MLAEINEQIAQFPTWIQRWLVWMQFILIVCPVLFIKFREAQALVVAQVFNFAVGAVVVILQNYQVTKLFGLGHVFWAVAFVYILRRWLKGKIKLQGFDAYNLAYVVWLPTAMLTLVVSLVFDGYDLVAYANGLRMPLIEYYNQR
ncbi:MAG: hypothetical protein COA96_10550 [SAR86 cluster bacterium]|uniref:Uncharacterized protein n=1 Tax=SAR86 cluster bacterium TaxID=2030880 RepID=A0A2A5AY67_9GAMM|nr:MAG: hypothetical protein COA96_10550 [SAR86 cluster bacterium]